jgi:hypothetical protein
VHSICLWLCFGHWFYCKHTKNSLVFQWSVSFHSTNFIFQGMIHEVKIFNVSAILLFSVNNMPIVSWIIIRMTLMSLLLQKFAEPVFHWDGTVFRPQLIPFKSFPVHHSFIVHPSSCISASCCIDVSLFTFTSVPMQLCSWSLLNLKKH